MVTYKELQDQISELQTKAEETRIKEMDGAIQQIKALMDEYALTPEDLGNPVKKKGSKHKQKANIQFQDENGNTWSGRGRMPEWLKGKDKEKFRI